MKISEYIFQETLWKVALDIINSLCQKLFLKPKHTTHEKDFLCFSVEKSMMIHHASNELIDHLCDKLPNVPAGRQSTALFNAHVRPRGWNSESMWV